VGTNRPPDYSDWPAEIQQVYDAVARTSAATGKENQDVLASALERLSFFMNQQENETLSIVAVAAAFEIQLRTAPKRVAVHLYRDRGQWASRRAIKTLVSSADENARRYAEKLLKAVHTKFPPKSRA
jgi:hypothetical protein